MVISCGLSRQYADIKRLRTAHLVNYRSCPPVFGGILACCMFVVVFPGLLKHKEGYILKSVEGGKKGKNEVRFYEELKDDTSLISLRQLVPSYFGTVVLKINSKGQYLFV